MRPRWWLCALGILFAPGEVSAQMKPHRAEYVLRLGVAANAPRIGTVVQNITFDCKKWHIERNVVSEIAFTPSFKVSFRSKLDGEEAIDGNAFGYQLAEAKNGVEHSTDGKVRKVDGQFRAELVGSDGAKQLVLPSTTLLPVAAINVSIKRLLGGEKSLQEPVFGAESTGEAFSLGVEALPQESLRALPPAMSPVAVPAQKSWSIAVVGTRTSERRQEPLFSLWAKLFQSGVLDRLTISTGVATVAADLQRLEMHAVPSCSK